MKIETHPTTEQLEDALNQHAEWLASADPITTDGYRADFRGADLRGLDFSGRDLRLALFCEANLSGAIFCDANLQNANFSYSILRNTDFTGANLQDAEMRSANCEFAILRDANLQGARLNATITTAEMYHAKLSSDTLVTTDVTYAEFCKKIVPALCTAGGATLEAVAQAWDCHCWCNCPMHVAFGVMGLQDIPPMYREMANLFIRLFDAELIPKPAVP